MAQANVPEQMTAVVLDDYAGLEALRVERRPVPRPGKNEVLVKVAAAPINPSDLAFLDGQYGFKKPTPVVPGFEGSGTVVATGGGLIGRYLHGKRVACGSQRQGDGTWAEYMVAGPGSALPLAASVSLEQGSMSVVNPLTAVAFMEMAKAGDHRAIVLTAAASALGQMVNRLSQRQGIAVINVVRRQEQVDFLEEKGATVVVNSSAPHFAEELRAACRQHDARLAFDAVAGPLTMQVLEAMPRHSKVTVYGGLSLEPARANPGHLIFHEKAVDGFWLTSWLGRKHFVTLLLLWRRAQKLLADELKSDVRARYPLREARRAIRDYWDEMTGGKVLLQPGR